MRQRDPLIITAAICGAETMKDLNPAVTTKNRNRFPMLEAYGLGQGAQFLAHPVIMLFGEFLSLFQADALGDNQMKGAVLGVQTQSHTSGPRAAKDAHMGRKR